MAVRVIRYNRDQCYSVTLAAAVTVGQLVGYNNLGTGSLADRDGTQGNTVADKAIGYATAAGAIGATILVAPICVVDGFSGLTPGAPVYTSPTAGGISQAAPSVNGHIWQQVGVARTATQVAGNVQGALKFQTAADSTLAGY